MISDEPDEDADALDDDAALDAYLGDTAPRSEGSPRTMREWPGAEAHDIGLNLDAGTLTWFKATHADWRHGMRCVLRAWVVANAPQRQLPQPLSLTAPVTPGGSPTDGRPADRP